MKKQMTVNQIGFIIVGMSALNLWGGGSGTIPMEPVKLMQNTYPTTEQIREAVNDNGFGVESILGAVVRVDTLYEYGAKEYGEEQLVTLCPDRCYKHLGEVLSWDHPESPVCLWSLPDEQLMQIGLL